jgi:peptidoglycan-associated lipoprotein
VRAIVCILLTGGLMACASSGSSTPPPGGAGTRQITSEPTTTRGNDSDNEAGKQLQAAYFDYDDFNLRVDAKNALRSNAEVLKQRSASRVELQGNCDERGTEEYNLALGKRRAESAKRYLADLGIADNRMSTVSFGEENPAVQGSSEQAWAKNRRVDFVLR